MAGIEWARTQPATRSQTQSLLDRLPRGLIDWEFVLTLLLCLGAAASVSTAIEGGGWSNDMPPLTTVTVLSVLSASLLARTRTSVFLAWPLAIVLGAAVVLWQTLSLVGPGTLEQRLDEINTRFDFWFDVAFGSGVSNDALPRDVLTLALTWLGVFLFGWSVFRWHNAWIGLIPGGIVLFLDLVLVGDDLTGTVVIYMLLGFLLVMQTNLLANLKRWRAEGTDYPSYINLSFLHFSTWALVCLIVFAWLVPAGPYNTPAPVQAAIDEAVETGAGFVRLAGPLHSKKVIPIHSYSGVLPFQGSINLGDRELMAVTVTDPTVGGNFLLRGSVYDNYEGGGWTTGNRREVTIPDGATNAIPRVTLNDVPVEPSGIEVPLHIEMLAKSVVGTVIFSPGQPLSLDRELTLDVPEGAISRSRPSDLVGGAQYTSDEDVFALTLAPTDLPVAVVRDKVGRVLYVEYLDLGASGLNQALEIVPNDRIKRYRSYDVTGLVPDVTPDQLRATNADLTPGWVNYEYLQLPATLPRSVGDLARTITVDSDTRYDGAKDIETYLRQFPVDYNVPDTPANRDTVDYFLNDLKRGYFDYHASAMVVMLRTLDVPARLAVGFAVDDADYDLETGAYIVRDEDSYAWPEVYFPEYGWIGFNPTPDRPADLEPRRFDPAFLDDPLGLDPRLRAQLPIGATDSFYIPPDVEPIPIDGPGSAFGNSEGSGPRPWLMMAVIAFAVAIIVAVSLGWQRSVAGLPYPQQLWEKTVRLASWGGFQPQPGQTPHEYVDALGRRHRAVRDLDVLSSTYTRSRFGKKDADESERERLEELWSSLRGALLRGIAGRVFRRNRRQP
ncbi:MAG: transglutaminase domain-containing protein [Dehalococcoidia bacterium]